MIYRSSDGACRVHKLRIDYFPFYRLEVQSQGIR